MRTAASALCMASGLVSALGFFFFAMEYDQVLLQMGEFGLVICVVSFFVGRFWPRGK